MSETFEEQWEQWGPRFAMDVAARQKKEDLQAIEHDLMGKLDSYGIFRVVDQDQATESRLHVEYMTLKTMEIHEQLSYKPQADTWRTDGTLDARALVDALIAYNDEIDFQNQVTKAAAQLIYYQNHPEVGFSVALLEKAKKTDQAELLVLYGHPLGSPWQQFFDDVVPGEGLKQGRPYDDQLIDDEWDRSPDFGKKNRDKAQSIYEAMDLIGTGLHEDHQILMRVVAVLLGMQSIAEAHAAKGLNNYEQRQGEMREYAGEFGVLDGLQVSQLVEFFDQKFPLEA